MALNDRIFLSNDSVGGGIKTDAQEFFFSPFINETSAVATSSEQLIPFVIAKQNGHIKDLYVGVSQTAVSASGFVSGAVSANVRINSALVCSTGPSVVMASASAANNRTATNSPNNVAGVKTSAVINYQSAQFSAGDMISLDWAAYSAGSAAAGLAMTGPYFGVLLHYYAQ
jgi:hypothetical protein